MFYLWIAFLSARLVIGQNNYVCKAGHGAVLAGDKLLIDGGMAAYSPKYPSYDNRTWIIDLSESWTNDSVQPASVYRPRAQPQTSSASLWYDPTTNSVYSFGGERIQNDGTVKDLKSTVPLEGSIWQFKLNEGRSSGQWSEALGPQGTKGPFPSDVSSSVSGATASDGRHAYYIGGRTSEWSNKAANTSLHNLPGLITFDFATATLNNSTNDGSYFASHLREPSANSTDSMAYAGLMTYTPPFGAEGVFVLAGGVEVAREDGWRTKQWSGNITIYDPLTRLWHYQRATGDVPELVWNRSYCAFGAHDPSLSTYDIFLFGHFASGPTFYVLSLPSFTWHATGVTLNPGRTAMSCTSTNNRQAIIVGGTSTDQADYSGPQNWEAQDPWTKGIHVFDMTELSFVDKYDTDALQYEASALLRNYYDSSQRFPIWDDPALENIFNSSAAPWGNEASSHLSGAAIFEIVIGTVVAAAVLGGFVAWRVWKRRKIVSTPTMSQKAPRTVSPRNEVDREGKEKYDLLNLTRKTQRSIDLSIRLSSFNTTKAGTLDFLGEIAATIRRDTNISDAATHKAIFEVIWELQQCLRDDLDGEGLGKYLTITGDIHSNFWATSCREYVSSRWGHIGLDMLTALETILQKNHMTKDTIDQFLPDDKLKVVLRSAEDENEGLSSIITYKGSSGEIVTLAQLLSWLTATFRQPRFERTCRSNVAFWTLDSALTYGIRLDVLSDIEDGELGTCWKPLFPSTVVAHGFPVLVRPRSDWPGLQISLAAMFESAEILSNVAFENTDGVCTGVFFEGIVWRLYPTNYIKEARTIQWHLTTVPSGATLKPVLEPDHDSGPRWCREVSREDLENSTAILGYCDTVNVKLGTKSQMSQHAKYLSSRSEIERPLPEVSMSAINMASGTKPNISLGATFKPRKALKVEQERAKEYSYTQMLGFATREPVILFDTELGNERAWMVPQLCLILDLYNFWAAKHEDAEVRREVRYAKLGPDGGENARTVLKDAQFSGKILIKSSYPGDPEQSAGAIIKRIWGRIRNRVNTEADSDEGARGTWSPGRTPIRGWDWMELIDESSGPGSYRRNTRPRTAWSDKPSWLLLAKTLPVILGQNIGEALEPAHLDNVCKHWYPLPGGFDANYLAASVRCLEDLSRLRGDISKLCDRVIWKTSYKDACIFEPCTSQCRRDSKKCPKHPQSLEKLVSRVKKPMSHSGDESLFFPPSDGAVVFAHKRRRESKLISGQIEDLNGLEAKNGGIAIADILQKHKAPDAKLPVRGGEDNP